MLYLHLSRQRLLSGTHNFASGGNSFKLALYTDISGLTASTTAFTTTTKLVLLAQTIHLEVTPYLVRLFHPMEQLLC